MEVRVNKDIQEYTENMFFGLTMRQFFCAVLGCATSVGLYFFARNLIGLELTTWMCIIGAAPWAAIGFLKYNGMTAEQFAVTWFRTRFINPKRYSCEPTTYYYEILKGGKDD